MTYRKFKADYLFLGDRLAAPDSVLITTAEGVVCEVVAGSGAGEGVELFPGLLTPGFVNGHCHLELSHLKGAIPEGTGLVDFLIGVIRRRADAAAAAAAAGAAAGAGLAERIREAIAAGEREMLENGIVAVGDICNTSDTLEFKRTGRLEYRNFMETIGFIEGAAAGRFEAGRLLFDRFETVAPERNSIVAHAPYSVSAALFRLIADFHPPGLQTIHNQESGAENEWMLAGKGDFKRLYQELGVDVASFGGTGKRSMESVMGFFQPERPMILVHNVATTKEDLLAVGLRPDLFFCLCPNANRYIGGTLPDVEMLAAAGCRLVIGTDSLASNHSLSILEELKTLAAAFPKLETQVLLRWATAEGAAALQMTDRLGSFEAGKTPGVLLLGGLDGTRLTDATTVRRLI